MCKIIMPRDKSRYRERRSTSYSSESSYERKKSKSKHKRRSRSTDRSESSSHRRKRSTSRSKRKRKSYSRSVSRDRYEKSRRRSRSKSRSRKDRSRSPPRSQSKTKHKKSNKKSRRRSRSSSSRSSFDIEPLNASKIKLDDTDLKVEKAIKAAEAAGFTMTKLPIYEYKEVEVKEDMPTIQDRNLLAELNSDSFVQKSFTSSKNKKESKNIVIDLDAQTVKIPDADKPKDDSIINLEELQSEEELRDMWIKKLYQYRKRMIRGEI